MDHRVTELQNHYRIIESIQDTFKDDQVQLLCAMGKDLPLHQVA